MPQKEEFLGLFDIANQMKKKKIKEKTSIEKEPKAVLSSEEIQVAFQKCKQQYEEIKQKIETVFDKAKVSPRQLHEYLKNPSNFTEQDWMVICKQRKELEGKLKEELEAIRGETPKPEKQEKQKRAKKGFSEKNRWIPM